MPENFIKLSDAIVLTSNYRENRNELLNEKYQNTDVLANCETYNRDAFDAVLAQPGCASVRIYYGMDDALKVKAIIVGVDAAGKDILPSNPEDDDSNIIDRGMRCPVECPPDSPLNG